MKSARIPVVTVDAVVSECLYLLRRNRLDPAGLLALLERGVLAVDPEPDTARVVALCRSYGDVPMSWADGSLVALSERRPKAQLLTFDSDFAVYRRFRNQRLPLLCPLGPRRQRP